MNEAYDTMIRLLEERNMSYRSSVEHGAVATDVEGEVATYTIMALACEEFGLFQVYGLYPGTVPVGSRSDIAELVARANWTLPAGKLEFEIDQGELRFAIHQFMVDGKLDADIIIELIETTLQMLDTYIPAALSVIYGNETPKDAVRRAEGFAPEHHNAERKRRQRWNLPDM